VPDIAQLVLSIESPVGSVGEDVHDAGVVPPKVGVMVVMAEFLAKL
jgi:hypothetical protein